MLELRWPILGLLCWFEILLGSPVPFFFSLALELWASLEPFWPPLKALA